MSLVFQVATGIETRIVDLAGLIKRLAIQSGHKPLELIFKGTRKAEIRKNYADITKAKELLGFRPEIELAKGLKKLWKVGG